MKATRKIGKNRGTARLWLEGKILINAGFKRGDYFDIEYNDNGFSLVPNKQGARKVSGKADKPIIDICGGAITQAGFLTGDIVAVEIIQDVIVVTGGEA